MPRTIRDIEKIWLNVEGVKKLSDRAIAIGPFGIGLDGLLTWIPVVGTAYTVGAAAWLMLQGVRANAAPSTLLRMATYLGLDTAMTATGEAVPLVPDVLDVLFVGHLMAAKALQKDIESTHWVEADERQARKAGHHDRHLAEARGQRKRRVVYLG